MPDNLFSLENESFKITVSAHGAELQSIFDKAQALEILWQGDEKYWARRSPVLFPIVGRLKNDKLVYKHKEYELTQHGFARDCEFEMIYQTETQLEFRLVANEYTKPKYPFDFELIVAYQLMGNRLITNFVVRNTGEGDLPFSLGGHPAFNWPLIDTVQKEQHFVEFECNELTHVQQLKEGLLINEEYPSPVRDKKIQLKDGLFDNDALIFSRLRNRKVTYHAADKYSVTMQFDDFPHFGLWTKPGAPFICLEPWYGYASPEDFDDDIRTKPGILLLPEHGESQMIYSMEFNAIPGK